MLQIYKHAFDKQSQTCKPKKAWGTHWILQKLSAVITCHHFE